MATEHRQEHGRRPQQQDRKKQSTERQERTDEEWRCDNCGAEFETEAELKQHAKNCG